MLMGNTLAITNIATSATRGSISMEVMTHFHCGGGTGRRYRDGKGHTHRSSVAPNTLSSR